MVDNWQLTLSDVTVVDVYLGMYPIKMATPILMYYGASANGSEPKASLE